MQWNKEGIKGSKEGIKGSKEGMQRKKEGIKGNKEGMQWKKEGMKKKQKEITGMACCGIKGWMDVRALNFFQKRCGDLDG